MIMKFKIGCFYHTYEAKLKSHNAIQEDNCVDLSKNSMRLALAANKEKVASSFLYKMQPNYRFSAN